MPAGCRFTVTLLEPFAETVPLVLPPSNVTGSVAAMKNGPASTLPNCAVPLLWVAPLSVPPN